MEAFQRLEREFAAFNGLDPAGMVACSSGTSALHLAFEAMRLPAGSEVLVPDYNMVACPRAVTLAGLVPAFVDCDERLLMSMRHAGEAYRENETRAVLFVHIYGRRYDVNRFAWAAVNHVEPPGIAIVEDLAEAHGVKPHLQTDAAAWSFYRNKIIAGEEGGAVWFRDPAHAALARELRTLGFTAAHDYTHTPRGHNYRLSNAHADLILDSLHHYPRNLAERRRLEAAYDRHCPAEWRMPPRQAPWVYDLRIPGMARPQQIEVVRTLQAAGFSARFGFWPMSRQEEYQGCRVVGNGNAVRLASEVVYLPLTPGQVTEDGCQRAMEIIARIA